MIDKTTLERIVAAGALAPSGDNSQPWKFATNDKSITLFGVFGKDNAFLNWNQGGTLIALGAALENMVIAASAEGLSVRVEYLPGVPKQNAVARLCFEPANDAPDPLYPEIVHRHTNRKPYRKEPLPDNVRDALSREIPEESGICVRIIDDPERILALAHAGSRAEVAILENEQLHALLFGNACFTQEEERERKEGLYVKTLELNTVQEIVFRICRNWPIMRQLNKIKFARFIANEDAKVYASASAYIAVVAQGTASEDFLRAGRAAERLWLRATALGYAVHPIVATLFFGLRSRAQAEQGMTPEHWTMMCEAYRSIEHAVGSSGDPVLFMFRIGTAPPPSARSSKKPPLVVAEEWTAYPQGRPHVVR